MAMTSPWGHHPSWRTAPEGRAITGMRQAHKLNEWAGQESRNGQTIDPRSANSSSSVHHSDYFSDHKYASLLREENQINFRPISPTSREQLNALNPPPNGSYGDREQFLKSMRNLRENISGS